MCISSAGELVRTSQINLKPSAVDTHLQIATWCDKLNGVYFISSNNYFEVCIVCIRICHLSKWFVVLFVNSQKEMKGGGLTSFVLGC